MAGDIACAVAAVATLCGLGLLVYRHGLAGTWHRLKATLHELFNLRLPPPGLVRTLMHGRPAPAPPPVRKEIDLARLEAIAAVPILDIIVAAERRATHPDEAEPEILANLDPAKWQIPSPVRPYVVLTPSTEDQKVQLAARFRTGANADGKACVITPAGMTYVQIAPDPAPFTGQVRDLVRTERPKGFYDDCEHPSAIHEKITTAASSFPIRTIVKSCVQCEDQHRLKQILTEMEALIAEGNARDATFGAFALSKAQVARYCALTAEADAISDRRYAAVEMADLRKQLRASAGVTFDTGGFISPAVNPPA